MISGSRYANLKKDDINKLQKLEKEIGKIVLAYEPERKSPYAELDERQVDRIRALETELGVILLAYKRPDESGVSS